VPIRARLGRSNQVWDAVATLQRTNRRIAMFRCPQMVPWPKWTKPQDSCLNRLMKRWFYGYFFRFPRPLAEGNG